MSVLLVDLEFSFLLHLLQMARNIIIIVVLCVYKGANWLLLSPIERHCVIFSFTLHLTQKRFFDNENGI